ncbi:hypothetical protein KJ644_03450 [Candidatus Dependentiae bacterium]|nr:hypothetical protein [Candidatus Dependentiae bacterium]MBU4387502.1 hypothetical protein [Candidatus Dependentiae bacterium]MCG2756306.1 hypothetical protein [Candidatus Dependentiae bacterium]
MKKLSKILAVFVLIIFSKSIFAMNYRGKYDIENGNNGINVELKRLTLNQFLNIFPGIDDKKKEAFVNFDIIEVAVTNDNESDYLINSDIVVPEKIYNFNDYSNLESLCDNGCKALAGLVTLGGAALAGITWLLGNGSFNSRNLGSDIIFPSIVFCVPALAAYLGYKGVKFACIDDSKEDRDEKMYKFLYDWNITFGQTIIKAKTNITKYCLFFRGANKYNLTFTNKKNSDEEIIFNFSPKNIIDKENIEIENDPVSDDSREDEQKEGGSYWDDYYEEEKN